MLFTAAKVRCSKTPYVLTAALGVLPNCVLIASLVSVLV